MAIGSGVTASVVVEKEKQSGRGPALVLVRVLGVRAFMRAFMRACAILCVLLRYSSSTAALQQYDCFARSAFLFSLRAWIRCVDVMVVLALVPH